MIQIRMTKLLLIAFFGCLTVTMALAQGKTFKLGFELQGYPTGFIPGVRGDLYFSDFSKLHVRAGYNIVRHGDAGEHDDERGGGFGFTVGYDILPAANHRWTIGARADLWFNEVDWYDDLPGGRVEGTSNVTVFQPTLQAGYRIPLREGTEMMPTLAFGYEFNVQTKGAEIGHGAILLLGVVLNFEL